MNNVFSINRRRPFHYNQNRGGLLEEALFFTGVALTVVLPEGICAVLGGSITATALTASLVIGTVAGVIRYYWFPFRIISCVSKGNISQAPPKAPSGAAVALKRVA